MKKIALIFITILSVNLWCQDIKKEAVKADSLQKMRVYALEGISVIAEKPEESIGSIEVKHFSSLEPVIDVNVSEALDDVSGLDLTVGGKNGSNLTIRGFKEEEIKILVDGRPVSGNYMDAVDLTTLPLADVKEVQILKGPVSSLYGSDTMGGVVNIITQTPGHKLQMKLGSQFRRNNTNKFYANVSQDLGIIDFSFYASRYNSDGMVLSNDFIPTAFENGNIRNHDKRTQYDIQAKLNFDVLDFHKFGLQYGHTTMPTKEIPSNVHESMNREFTDWDRWQISAFASLQLHYNLKFNSRVYYDQYADTYVEYLDEFYEEINPRYPSTLESWTFGTNQKADWQVNDILTIMSGIRYEKKAYNRKDNSGYLTWTSNNTQQMDYYLQSQFNFNELSFSAGSGISTFKSKNSDELNLHVQPSAGIYYTSSHKLKLSLAASINTKYPTLRQLYSNSSGNENLQEESAFKTELTAKQPFVIKNMAGSCSGAIFFNNVTDMIDKLGGIYANIDEVESYGFESEFKLKFGWEHEIDYSWIKFADGSDELLVGAPEHRVNILETVKLPWDIKFRYKAGWKAIRLTEEGDELPSYWLQAVQFNKNINKFKLGFALENILDKNYEDELGYPGEGRNFILNVEYNL